MKVIVTGSAGFIGLALSNKLLDIVTISKEAGNSIMLIYDQDFEVEYKQDKSPD